MIADEAAGGDLLKVEKAVSGLHLPSKYEVVVIRKLKAT